MPYEGFYIGFVLIFNVFGANPPPHMNHSRINQIEMTVSRDLRHWERVADREVFIGIEPWDGVRYNTSQVAMAGRPIVGENGEIFIYHMASRIPSGKELYATHNRNKELLGRIRSSTSSYLMMLQCDVFHRTGKRSTKGPGCRVTSKSLASR